MHQAKMALNDLRLLFYNRVPQSHSKTFLLSPNESREKLKGWIPTSKINGIYRNVEEEVPWLPSSGWDDVEGNLKVHYGSTERIQLSAFQQGFANIHSLLVRAEDSLEECLQALESGQKEIREDQDSKIDKPKDVPTSFSQSISDNNLNILHKPVMSVSVAKGSASSSIFFAILTSYSCNH